MHQIVQIHMHRQVLMHAYGGDEAFTKGRCSSTMRSRRAILVAGLT